MSVTPTVLSSARSATSLFDFTRRLGYVCIEQGAEISRLRDNEAARDTFEEIEARIAAIDPKLWRRPLRRGGFVPLLADADDSLAALLEDAHAWGPLPHLATLRGLCAMALVEAYLVEDGEVPLDRGSVIPYVERPLKGVIPNLTPRLSRLTAGEPLYPAPFDLFAGGAGERTRVILDFRYRDRLDEVTWDATGRLPRIGTYHPSLRLDDLTMSKTRETFFDVEPLSFDLDALDVELRAAATSRAAIAVAAELSLPAINALAGVLAAEPDAFPPLVVAGTAHIHGVDAGGNEIRANRCHVFLDGEPVLTHDKIYPFLLAMKDGERTEDLTNEPKVIRVLSGGRTRLAVVICADLNHRSVQTLLTEAWVNMLIVPALTPKTGAFSGAVGQLAGNCQALAVVVNGALDDPPFHVLAARPVDDPAEQVIRYLAPDDPHDARGTYDPNGQQATMRWR